MGGFASRVDEDTDFHDNNDKPSRTSFSSLFGSSSSGKRKHVATTTPTPPSSSTTCARGATHDAAAAASQPISSNIFVVSVLPPSNKLALTKTQSEVRLITNIIFICSFHSHLEFLFTDLIYEQILMDPYHSKFQTRTHSTSFATDSVVARCHLAGSR